MENWYTQRKVLVVASVASMIDQFNLPNIRLLQDIGYTVHVACNFMEGNTCDDARIGRLHRILLEMRVVCHQWNCPRDVRPISKCVRAYLQFVELLGRYPFAWIHCQSPVGGMLARMAAHRAGIPVIYTAHGFHFYQGAPVKNWLLYYPAEWLLACWTDVLITINQEDYRLAMRSLRAKKLYLIPGVGVDCGKFAVAGYDKGARKAEIRKKYGIPAHALLLLSVGELSRRKNHKAVITALSAVADQNVYYMICGQGDQRDPLMRQAKRLGVAGRVILAGFQWDTASFYQAADLFVFPSIQEGMPVALMEAMAAGLACVVSDIRGNRELIGNCLDVRFGLACEQAAIMAGGIRFPLHKSKRLQEALLFLLKNKSLRQACGVRNQEKIKSYSLAVVERRMRKAYRQLDWLAKGADYNSFQEDGAEKRGRAKG